MEKKYFIDIVINKEKLSDGSHIFVAHCLSLGISSQGKDTDEAIKNIKEAVELYLEEQPEKYDELMSDGIHLFSVVEVKRMPQKTILFGPDENLAYYVQKRVPEKKIVSIPAKGHCLTHAKLITKSEVEMVKLDHPKALVLVHPECSPEVQELADCIESTNGMVKKAASLPEKEFIIV